MPTLNLALHNYLLSLSVLKGEKKTSSLHRPSPVSLAECVAICCRSIIFNNTIAINNIFNKTFFNMFL